MCVKINLDTVVSHYCNYGFTTKALKVATPKMIIAHAYYSNLIIPVGGVMVA